LIVPATEVIQIEDEEHVGSSSSGNSVSLEPPPRSQILNRYLSWKHNLLDIRGGPGESLIPSLPEDLSTIALDEPNQRVIRVDCERTRGSHEEFRCEKNRLIMESIITFYCKSQNVKYKQGMNEVLAPFVYLKFELDKDNHLGEESRPSWSIIFQMYYAFIEIYLSKMFDDEDFKFLQKCCILFRSLLRYHAPALSARLDSGSVTPEMYVTPWFLTLFASKTSLHALLEIWDHLIANGGDKH